ncbi:MAG: Rrf2 family transcriptional regulator [Candidatus Margulisiibacteriota bacterium]
MLSKKTKYALNALVYLAKLPEGEPQLIAAIATQTQIPKKFLELILLELKNNGILESKKGAGGGYFLKMAPADITLGRVIRLLSGPLALAPCVSKMAYMPCQECKNVEACGLKCILAEVRDSVSGILDRYTILDILDKEKKLKAQAECKPAMFYI